MILLMAGESRLIVLMLEIKDGDSSLQLRNKTQSLLLFLPKKSKPTGEYYCLKSLLFCTFYNTEVYFSKLGRLLRSLLVVVFSGKARFLCFYLKLGTLEQGKGIEADWASEKKLHNQAVIFSLSRT